MTPRRRKVKGSSPKSKVKKILARWSDGLFYVIKILKVSEIKKRCLVEFEDQSTAYVHFKDLLDEHKEESKTCHNCGGEDELENNAFIRCTNCDREYHRHCHVPPIISDPMAKQFVCRICVFAACARAGGAKDTGPMAARFMFMKREFPYDLEHLSWNPSHTSNTSECYCYCGGPGNFFNKMLQCCRCQQWFHEACVQCINGGVLMGDRFYIFACAHCNYGEEFLKRLELSWHSIVYIALFHLSMTQGLKYTDLDTDIVPFLKEHEDNFRLQQVLNVRSLDPAVLREKVLEVVTSQIDVYCCGAKVKKKHSLYGLRERIPHPPPSFYIPYQAEKISNLTLANTLGKRSLFKPPRYLNPVPYLIRGANKFIPSTMSMKLREASMARLKSEHNYCSTSDEHSSSSDSTFSKESFDANNNSPMRQHTIKTEIPDDISDDFSNDPEVCGNDPVERICPISLADSRDNKIELVESGQPNTAENGEKTEFWSLDTAFPEPTDFSGINNPFLTEFELQDLKAQRQHFVEHLDYLSQTMKDSMKQTNFSKKEEQQSSSPSRPPSISVPDGVLKNIKGFKGELAKIFKTNGFASSSSPVTSKDINPKSLFTTPEKITRNSSPSPKRGRSCSSNTNYNTSSQGSNGLDTTVINGVKLSPQFKSRFMNKNGYKHNHRYSNSHETNSGDDKRLDAVSRCLKNLIPTCGFHFPVLEENHPSVVNGFGIEDSVISDSSSSSSSKLHTSTRRGLKRKHPSHSNRRSSSQRQCYEELQQENNNSSQSNSENVRRSHRSRQKVKRFETSDMERGNSDSLNSDAQLNSSILSAAKYNVISLRARHDNTVDYLIDWFE